MSELGHKSEHGYKLAPNCTLRQIELRNRISAAHNEVLAIVRQLGELLDTVDRLGYDFSILAHNSCCQDPDCPECRDFPEKSAVKGCNVTVDLRRDCPPE